MTVIPHFASDEIESGELNARGDLTMWKRFNGADAVRNSLQACLLASVGVEGAVRPFVGKLGFINKLANKTDDAILVLRTKLDAGQPLSRVCETYFKRWPVGSLAQSAIQARYRRATKAGDIAASKKSACSPRKAPTSTWSKSARIPWHPISRETADHSLPYIVAAAVLDGDVRTESSISAECSMPARQRFLAEKVRSAPRPNWARSPAANSARTSRLSLARRD